MPVFAVEASAATGLRAGGSTAAPGAKALQPMQRTTGPIKTPGPSWVNSLFAKHCASRPTSDSSPYRIFSIEGASYFPFTCGVKAILSVYETHQSIDSSGSRPRHPHTRVQSRARQTAPLRIAPRRSLEPHPCRANHLRFPPPAICCAQAGRELQHDSRRIYATASAEEERGGSNSAARANWSFVVPIGLALPR